MDVDTSIHQEYEEEKMVLLQNKKEPSAEKKVRLEKEQEERERE